VGIGVDGMAHKRSCSLCRTEVGGGAWRMRSVHALHFHKERTKKRCVDSEKVRFLTIFRRTDDLEKFYACTHFTFIKSGQKNDV